MSFGNHTPESILPRTDSKNPATTCKGLTSSGRPCRRALAASLTNSPTRDQNGVIAVLDEGAAAAFFCWQHKDQAETLVAKLQERSRIVPLKEKSSIDTLIERVGILDLDDVVQESPSVNRQRLNGRQRSSHQAIKNRSTMPLEWRDIQSPLMSLPEEITEINSSPRQQSREQSSRPPRRRHGANRVGQSNVKASWSCCIRIADDEDDSRAPRRRRQDIRQTPRSHDNTGLSSVDPSLESQYQPAATGMPVRYKPNNRSEMQQSPVSANGAYSTPIRRMLQPRSSNSTPSNPQTASFLSLIPSHLTPATTSALLSELSKPISNADDEGYIYIFWLTPETDLSKPDDEVASSLLDSYDHSPPSSPSKNTQTPKSNPNQLPTSKSTTQALQRFASTNKSKSTQTRKILLKIGRAANVHRRLSQWTKQCGQNITLIRYYPYQQQQQPSSPQSQPQPSSHAQQSKRTVPHVHRVERLIHLELSDKRVTDKETCEACGRIHKEWFEVSATREGVREVDEVVRRWVGWAEGSYRVNE